jgi:hypothetical protein
MWKWFLCYENCNTNSDARNSLLKWLLGLNSLYFLHFFGVTDSKRSFWVWQLLVQSVFKISGNFMLEVRFCKGSSKSEYGSYSWFLSFFRSVQISENHKILLPQKQCFPKQCIGQCVSEQLTSSPPHMSKLDSNLRHRYNKLHKVLRACPAAPIVAW